MSEPFPPHLYAAFAQVLASHGASCALLYPESGQRVSYQQLGALADRYGNALHARGLGPGDVLALFHDKSPEAYAVMFACLQRGVTYVNLDAGSPWGRLSKILETCQPRLVLKGQGDLPCDTDLRAWPGALALRISELAAVDTKRSPLPCFSAAAAAYIMFTSGSTGNPKGAVMSHANVLWFLSWAGRRFPLGPGAVLTQVNPMYFDNSVFDFYAALFSGATLVPLDAHQVRDPGRLVRLVGEAGCTLWFSVPSLLVYLLTTRAIEAESWPAMRTIVFGGEGFPKRRLRELHDLYGGQARLVNVYGPTECTCICSAHDIAAEDFDDMQSLAPLGRLSENFDYEILPQDGGADMNTGELLLRGPQVGLGYYGDAVRSGHAFVQNPRHRLYADLGYRSGDLVRRDARGLLHFMGRVDFQIKHMGYRIELEEIEFALSSLPPVTECAVVYQALGEGLGQIVAYATVRADATESSLHTALAKLLPGYMLPRRLELLLQPLPKNANGKIDRGALLRRLDEQRAHP